MKPHTKMGPPRKPMQTRVPKTKSGRKTQPVDEPRRTPEQTAELISELNGKFIAKMKIVHATRQLEAQAAQVSARQRLITAADALLPKATALAHKGKPRLLAVLTKIINDRNIKFGQK
jgi:hypothetical protein